MALNNYSVNIHNAFNSYPVTNSHLLTNNHHVTDNYPAWLEVDLGAIAYNFRLIRSYLPPGTQVVAVLKSNGYGIGAKTISRLLLQEKVDYIGVVLVAEAKEIFDAGIPCKIFLMSPPFPHDITQAVKMGLEVTVPDIETALALSREAQKQEKKVFVHMKIDSGMSRLGVAPLEAPKLFNTLTKLPGIVIKGLYTHFPKSDEENKSDTMKSLELFHKAVKDCAGQPMNGNLYTGNSCNKYLDILCHAASSAIILDPFYSHCNINMGMVRPGVLLYGYPPSKKLAKFSQKYKPSLRLKSRIIQTRYLPAGAPIGYGGTFTAPKDGWLAVLAIGYGDGYSRGMSNKGKVLIGGNKFPIAGRVCMDHTMVFCGDFEPKRGDEAVLLGTQDKEEITMSEWEEWLETIPHEILCRFTSRLTRIYLSPGNNEQPCNQ